MSDIRKSVVLGNDEVPPSDRDAEQHVISAIIKDPDCFDEVNAIVRPDDFYYECHQILYHAILRLKEKGTVPDLVTIFQDMSKQQVENIGGSQYLVDIHMVAPTSMNVPVYAKIVREHADRRRLIYLANRVLRDCFEAKRPVTEVIEEIGSSLDGVERILDSNAVVHIAECLEDEKARIDRAYTGDAEESEGKPVLTGIGSIDRLMTGLYPGSVTVIGARPGVGKSSLGIQFCESAARQQFPSLFISLEMGRNELVSRQLAGAVPIDIRRLREARHITPMEASQIYETANDLSTLPIYYCDTFGMTVSEMSSIVRSSVRKHGIKLLVIDYLQLITSDLRGAIRTEQIADMTRRIKLLAKQYKLAVVLLSQLNRESEREESKPKLSALRESGSIEQDADNVILLWSRPTAEKTDFVMTVECSVEKQRHGPTADLQLIFKRPIARFEECFVSR